MTGWMSGNRAWKVGLAAARVPDEHKYYVPSSPKGWNLGCNNECTRAKWEVQDVQEANRRSTAQHTGFSAHDKRLRATAAAFPRPSKAKRVERVAGIGFAISNGCTALHTCRAGGPWVREVMSDQSPPGAAGQIWREGVGQATGT